MSGDELFDVEANSPVPSWATGLRCSVCGEGYANLREYNMRHNAGDPDQSHVDAAGSATGF